MSKREKDDAFLSGIVVALGIVYLHDQETIAEEIIEEVGPHALLRVAKQNEDCYLPQLKKTIRFLRSRRSTRETPRRSA